jgi:hypothetical protein
VNKKPFAPRVRKPIDEGDEAAMPSKRGKKKEAATPAKIEDDREMLGEGKVKLEPKKDDLAARRLGEKVEVVSRRLKVLLNVKASCSSLLQVTSNTRAIHNRI